VKRLISHTGPREATRPTLQGLVIVNPQYERSYVTIEDLDKDIREQFEMARKENGGTSYG
jgi:hypothetical protein